MRRTSDTAVPAPLLAAGCHVIISVERSATCSRLTTPVTARRSSSRTGEALREQVRRNPSLNLSRSQMQAPSGHTANASMMFRAQSRRSRSDSIVGAAQDRRAAAEVVRAKARRSAGARLTAPKARRRVGQGAVRRPLCADSERRWPGPRGMQQSRCTLRPAFTGQLCVCRVRVRVGLPPCPLGTALSAPTRPRRSRR